MEIRRLRESDAAQLKGLIAGIYDEMSYATKLWERPTDAFLESLLGMKMMKIAEGSAVDIVALDGGKLIGECEIIKDGSVGRVGIIIAKGFRRKGVGASLISAAEKQAREIGIERLVAEIAEENAAAVSFFKKMGFAVKGSVEMPMPVGNAARKVLIAEK